MRHFLTRAPRPAYFVALDADGEQIAKIAIGISRSKWADCERSIPRNAARVEARDAEGATMRGLDLAQGSDVPDSAAGAASSAAPAAAPLPGAAVTPLELARIVLDATDRGASRHASAYETSMAHLVELVREVQAQHAATLRRLASLEAAWHRVMRSAPAAEGEEQSPLDAMLPMLLAQFAGGAPPAPAPANGKGKHESP